MPHQLTVTTRDLQRLCAFGDVRRLGEKGDPLPSSLLEDLAALVPCDDVTYLAQNPYENTVLAAKDLRTDVEGVSDEDFPDFEDWFWSNYWIMDCSYPERSGDWVRVLRCSDLCTDRATKSAAAAFTAWTGVAFEAMLSLPPSGPVSRRILLSRYDGPDFSDRELLLLTLIRPHLVELHEAMLQSGRGPTLTARQAEVLRLVRGGLTNSQIARRLGISSGTVRKHLEHIYTTLEVTNRTAAAACADRLDMSPPSDALS